MKWVKVSDYLPREGRYIVRTERIHYPLKGENKEQVVQCTLIKSYDQTKKKDATTPPNIG